jgi:hypothetical protein
VRAPIESFTAVRDPLAPIEKPCVRPAAAFAAPIANSSCDARTFWRCFPANDRAVRISSANETRKMPSAAGTSSRTSASGGVGMVRLGRPAGIAPVTSIPWLARSSAHELAIATTTTSSAPGSKGTKKRSRKSAARATRLTTTVAPLTSPSSSSTSASWPSGSRASIESPSSLPS